MIIAGPGRSGTTFLVSLLTELGFDTGFDSTDVHAIDPLSHAGLETGIYRHIYERSPLNKAYILKAPMTSLVLDRACRKGDVHIEHVYVPFRDASDIARSRERISALGLTAGGLWDAGSAAEQRAQVERLFYDLMRAVATHELPFTLLDFPRLVRDPAYLYRKLDYLCSGIGYEMFADAFARTAHADWVHEFGAGT